MGPYGARPHKGPSPGPKVSGPGPEAPLLADLTEKSPLAAPNSVPAVPLKTVFWPNRKKTVLKTRLILIGGFFVLQEFLSIQFEFKRAKHDSWDRQNTHEDYFFWKNKIG